MQQLRTLLQQREAEASGARQPQRDSPLAELPGGRSGRLHASESSPASVGSGAPRRPGSASIVKLAVENARKDLERQRRASGSSAGGQSADTVPHQQPAAAGRADSRVRKVVRGDPGDMVVDLRQEPGGINSRDACGWTALHWAALESKREHVAALLDSGADATIASTKVVFHNQNGNNGDRSGGTLAEDLSRYPHASRRADPTVLKMLVAAGKGAWQSRIQWRGKGDGAARKGDYSRAIECYQQVR